MINEIKKDAQERMKKSVESLNHASAVFVPARPTPAFWKA
jgi:ribosome recycling factor